VIYLIEDEPVLRRSIHEYLMAAGHEVQSFPSAEEALSAARHSPPDAAVSDLQLPGMDGLELMSQLAGLDPSIVRIAMTAHSSVQTALQAMKAGCYEYLEKPVDLDRLSRLVGRALAERRSDRELAWHREGVTRRRADMPILGESPAIEAVRQQIQTLAELGHDGPPVLITGETGVGKGLIARVIHETRFGKEAPWIEVNCAALPKTLMESELFGYERSAFTDAKQAKPGLFEAASEGTMFLDEVGEIPLDVQVKLLKVVESQKVRRLGSVRDRSIKASLVAATNVDLHQAVDEKTFRADLYHRLAAFTIEVPPLRDRGDDAVILAQSFIPEIAERYRKAVRTLSPEAEDRVRRGRWPGNVRELRFAIERAVIMTPADAQTLAAEALPQAAPGNDHATGNGQGVRADQGPVQVSLPPGGVAFDELERAILEEALRHSDGNVAQAARFLGLKRDAMRYRIKKLGINVDGS
jgi:DNA-binding NtrC family response regulator